MTTVRYVRTRDLLAIDRVAAKTDCNRRLTYGSIKVLAELDYNMPIIFEMLHERGDEAEIRVMTMIDKVGRTVTFDIPIKYQERFIHTTEVTMPEAVEEGA